MTITGNQLQCVIWGFLILGFLSGFWTARILYRKSS